MIYILGAGPVAFSVSQRLLSFGFEVKIVTQHPRVDFLNNAFISYKEFRENASEKDALIIGWRTKYFNEDQLIVQPTLDFLEKQASLFSQIILLSSGSVYGNSDFVFTELSNPKPISEYAKGKLLLEQWCIETFKLNLSIFRISNIFGDPQFHDLINKILNSWKKDSVLALFDTNRFSRDIISIDDISMIVGQSLLNRFNPEGGVFYLNISSNIAITTDAILALIGDVAQYEIEVKSIETPGSVPIKHQLSNQKLLDFLPALRIDPMKDLEIYFRKRLEITPSRIDFRL